MGNDTKFWIGAVIFEIAFGLTVFAVTRAYYLGVGARSTPEAATMGGATAGAPDPSALAWPGAGADSGAAAVSAPLPSPPQSGPTAMDPAALAAQADAYYANEQYADAADLYQRLLALEPQSVDVYNNLAITLHYLGRSDEAVAKLKQGLAIDATHQRSWLTLGFIESQLGDTEAAREALGKAAEPGGDETIRGAALKMLDSLP